MSLPHTPKNKQNFKVTTNKQTNKNQPSHSWGWLYVGRHWLWKALDFMERTVWGVGRPISVPEDHQLSYTQTQVTGVLRRDMVFHCFLVCHLVS